MVDNAETNVRYRLIDAETGDSIGQPRMGQTNLILTTDEFNQDRKLQIVAQRLDVNSCETVSLPFDISVYNLSIIVTGNTLTASIPTNKAISYQWYREGVTILNGGQSRNLSIFDDAQYTVIVETIDGCIVEYSTEKDITIPTSGNGQLSFNFYPNPVHNDLTLTISNMEGDVTVRVIGFSGEILNNYLLNIDSDRYEQTFDVSELQTGIYLLQIVSQEKTEIKRFIKQ